MMILRWAAKAILAVALITPVEVLAQEAQPDQDEDPIPAASAVPLVSNLTPLSADRPIVAFPTLQRRLERSDAKLFSRAGEAISAAPTTDQTVAVVSQTCGAGKASLTDGWQVFAYSLDRNAAIALNLFGTAELAASDKVILYHFTWYNDVLDVDGAITARCGSGVQLALRATNLSASAQVTLPALAASTQLGLASVEYRISTFGISGAPIDAASPSAGSVGRFDAQAYAELMGSIDKVRLAGAAGTNVLFTPRIIAMPNGGESTTALRQTLVEVTALRHLAKGSSCATARAAIPGRNGETDAFVDQFYKSFARPRVCATIGGGVRQAERDRATSELTRFGIAVN